MIDFSIQHSAFSIQHSALHNARVIFARALRSWQHAKGVAFLAAAALAIGIGAATAIYSVVNAVMLKPLPLPEGNASSPCSKAIFSILTESGPYRARTSRPFSTGATRSTCSGGHRGSGQNLVFGGEAHHVSGIRLTIPFAQNLGVDPHIGRWFTDETGVMISNGLWRRLGSDAAIVGKR